MLHLLLCFTLTLYTEILAEDPPKVVSSQQVDSEEKQKRRESTKHNKNKPPKSKSKKRKHGVKDSGHNSIEKNIVQNSVSDKSGN